MTYDDDKKSDYTVGYCKPPKDKQFKPGQCANPNGRPKGSQNFSTIVQSELKTIIPITEQGQKKKISKKEALAKQLVNKGVAGDPRAMPILLDEIHRHEGHMDRSANNPPMPPITAETSNEEVTRIYREALKNARPAE